MSRDPLNYDTTVTVRYTDEQRKRLTAVANFQGMKRCDFIRQASMAAANRQLEELGFNIMLNGL